MFLGSYIGRLLDGDNKKGYLRGLCLDQIDTSLLDDVVPLPQFSNDLLRHHWKIENALKWLYMVGWAIVISLHVDIWNAQSWMLVIEGREKWVMLPPTAFSEAESLPLIFGDELRTFLAEMRLADALYFELLSGHVIYISGGWWHCLNKYRI